MDKVKIIKAIEKTADSICAEHLISKHSVEYRKTVFYISELFDMQNEIAFDKNNKPYLDEGV